jgi:hypothetical protein
MSTTTINETTTIDDLARELAAIAVDNVEFGNPGYTKFLRAFMQAHRIIDMFPEGVDMDRVVDVYNREVRRILVEEEIIAGSGTIVEPDASQTASLGGS